MSELDTIEAKLVDVVHAVMHDARTNEPAIEDAVATALTGFGAPAEIANGAKTLVGALLDHFSAQQQAAQAAASTAGEASG